LDPAEEFLDDFAFRGILGFFKGLIHGCREGLRGKSSDTVQLAVGSTVGVFLFILVIALVASWLSLCAAFSKIVEN
jgi:hypothetical protein